MDIEPTTSYGLRILFTARRVKIALAAAIVVLVVGGVWWWRSVANTPLLPAPITAEITDFTPYFFSHQVPGGYNFDPHQISFNDGMLFVTLTKKGSPSVVLSEQAMPANLSATDVQQNGAAVSGTTDPATINDIEGRLLGTMVASSHKTLILINAPGSASKDDITVLLQGLRPLR